MAKRKICRRCGNHPEVKEYANGLCEYCDSQVVKCVVCDEEQDDDYHCRHVFQDQNLTWQGSGNCFVKSPDPDVKKSLFKLLDQMPAGFAADLKVAIRAKSFHTWLIAPLIGNGGLLELHGMPKREGIRFLFGWGEHLLELGQSDDAEETADGYHWLASLYNDKTADGNTITLRWLTEYLRMQQRAELERDIDDEPMGNGSDGRPA